MPAVRIRLPSTNIIWKRSRIPGYIMIGLKLYAIYFSNNVEPLTLLSVYFYIYIFFFIDIYFIIISSETVTPVVYLNDSSRNIIIITYLSLQYYRFGLIILIPNTNMRVIHNPFIS